MNDEVKCIYSSSFVVHRSYFIVPSDPMDINLLVLNVGNSRLAVGAFVAGELQYVTRLSHEQRSDWPGAIAQAWEKLSGTQDRDIVGVSVNPAVMEQLEHA